MSDDKSLQIRKPRSLADTLSELKRQGRDRAPELVREGERLIGRLSAAGAGAGAPDVGDQMPDFLLPDGEGKLFRLADFLEAGPAIICFLRGKWCPYCSATKEALDAASSDARKLGVSIVGVTPERASAFECDSGDGCKILVDVDNGFALALNLLISLDDGAANAYRRHGIDISANQIGKSLFLPIPASFLISRDRTIVRRYLDTDFRNRLALDEFLEHAAIAADADSHASVSRK